MTVLAVASELSFPALCAKLSALGFARDASVRPATPDFVAGEPELAAFATADGGRLVYTFNPVVSLRLLTSFYILFESL